MLPDYQGIGIGTKLLNTVAEYWTQKTRKDLYIVTSNPQLKNLSKHSRWILKSYGHRIAGGAFRKRKDLEQTSSKFRQTFSFKYPRKVPSCKEPQV